MSVDIFTPAELAENDAYHLPGYVLLAVTTILSPIISWVLARYVTPPVYRWCERIIGSRASLSPAFERVWKGPGMGTALLFSFIFFQLLEVLNLPTSFYFGFIREHQYGMSNQSFGRYALDWLKSDLITVASVGALTLGLYGLARRMRHWWWILGIVAGLAMLSSTLIDPIRNSVYVDQEPLADGELRTRIIETMRKANIDFNNIVVEKTSGKSVRVQAYFAGEGPTRTIVLNDVIIDKMTIDEVVNAIGHEAGHVHESRGLRRAGAFFSLIAFLGGIEWLFRISARRKWLGITERADIRTLPMILLMFELATTVAEPIGAFVSRQGELAADRFSLNLIKQPEVFESMMVKAARINKMDPAPPRWRVWLDLDHPPVTERIEAVRAWAKENGE